MLHGVPATRQRILVPIQQVKGAHTRLAGVHRKHAQTGVHHTRALPRTTRRGERGQKRLAIVHAKHIVAAQRDHRQRVYVHRHRVPRVARAITVLQQIVVAARRQDARTQQSSLVIQQRPLRLRVHPRPAHRRRREIPLQLKRVRVVAHRRIQARIRHHGLGHRHLDRVRVRAARRIRRVRVHRLKRAQSADVRIVVAIGIQCARRAAQARPKARAQLTQARAEPLQRPRNRLVAKHRVQARVHHGQIQHIHRQRHFIGTAIPIGDQQRHRERINGHIHHGRCRGAGRSGHPGRHIGTPRKDIGRLTAHHIGTEFGNLPGAHRQICSRQRQFRPSQHRQGPGVLTEASPRSVLVRVEVISWPEGARIHRTRFGIGHVGPQPRSVGHRGEPTENQSSIDVTDDHIRARFGLFWDHHGHIQDIGVHAAFIVFKRVDQLGGPQSSKLGVENAQVSIHYTNTTPLPSRWTETNQLLGDGLVAQRQIVTGFDRRQWQHIHRQRHLIGATIPIGDQQRHRERINGHIHHGRCRGAGRSGHPGRHIGTPRKDIGRLTAHHIGTEFGNLPGAHRQICSRQRQFRPSQHRQGPGVLTEASPRSVLVRVEVISWPEGARIHRTRFGIGHVGPQPRSVGHRGEPTENQSSIDVTDDHVRARLRFFGLHHGDGDHIAVLAAVAIFKRVGQQGFTQSSQRRVKHAR